jgi:membrane-bound inhibitor of C-type lysozyme
MNSNSIRTSIIAATIVLGSLASGVAVANTTTQSKPSSTPTVAETKPAPKTPVAKPTTPAPAPAPTAKTVEYKCASKKTLKVDYSDKGAKFELDKKVVTLPSVKSASGAKYSDGKTTLSTKGTEVSVEANGKKVLEQCVAK